MWEEMSSFLTMTSSRSLSRPAAPQKFRGSVLTNPSSFSKAWNRNQVRFGLGMFSWEQGEREGNELPAAGVGSPFLEGFRSHVGVALGDTGSAGSGWTSN